MTYNPKGFLASEVFPATRVRGTGLDFEKTEPFLADEGCGLDTGVLLDTFFDVVLPADGAVNLADLIGGVLPELATALGLAVLIDAGRSFAVAVLSFPDVAAFGLGGVGLGAGRAF